MRKLKLQKPTVGQVVCYVFLLLLAAMCIVPFYNIFVNATHDNATIATGYQLFFGNKLMENYRELTGTVDVWRGFRNSLGVALTCTCLSCYFGSLTAFGFAKYRFKGNKILFWILLAIMMLPAQLSLIGYFQLMHTMHLIDTRISLIFPAMANASAVFFIRQFIHSAVSDSLLESARIDGCGEFRIFHQIVFPIITPAVFTQAIFIFIASWNNFINPLILIFSPDKMTLPVVIQQIKGPHMMNYGVLYLGISISVVPIIIFASLFLRKIVGGLTVGAVKG